MRRRGNKREKRREENIFKDKNEMHRGRKDFKKGRSKRTKEGRKEEEEQGERNEDEEIKERLKEHVKERKE